VAEACARLFIDCDCALMCACMQRHIALALFAPTILAANCGMCSSRFHTLFGGGGQMQASAQVLQLVPLVPIGAQEVATCCC